MKAYSYQRFSSAVQGTGSSTYRQSQLIDSYCQRHKLELVDSYSDLGVSAYRGDNVVAGELGAFAEAVRCQRIEAPCALLVESLDRLSRQSVSDALPFFIELIQLGVHVHTLSDGQVYSKQSLDNNWSQLIIGLAVMARANEESVIKGQRVKAAHRRKWAGGKASSKVLPAWLINVDGIVQPDPIRAGIVRHIFDLYLSGLGTRRIARALNADGVDTFGKSPTWQASYVDQILRTKTVLGQLVTVEGSTIDSFYPSVIDEDSWFRAQAQRQQNYQARGATKRKESPNLFTGLNICGNCGQPMRYDSCWNSNQKFYQYLGCRAAVRGEAENGCTNKGHRYEPLEYFILVGLMFIAPGEVDDSKLRDALAVAEGRWSDAHQQANKLAQAVALAPNISALTDQLRQAQADIEQAEDAVTMAKGALAQAQSGEDLTGSIRQALGFTEMAKLSDVLRRSVRAVVVNLIDRIAVDKSGTVRVLAKEGYCFEMIVTNPGGVRCRDRVAVYSYDGPERRGTAVRKWTIPVVSK